MRKLLLVFLFPVMCYGQGDQTIINVPIDANGTTFQAILHLPNDYGTTNTPYPLLMFFHGLGEGGPNPASIYTSSYAGGPAYFIAQGTFPTSFVNPKDGKSYKYIVVSPQANPQGVQGSTTAQELDYILSYVYAHYRVDTSRVYLTGLSDGGETTIEYVGGEMTNGGNLTRFTKKHHVAAIITMSENASASLMQEEADSLTAANIPAWGFGSTDTQGQNTMSLAWECNVIKPGAMITTSYSGGHCCWGQFYDPNFTQNGMSIYQWLLQYTSGPSSPPVIPPVTTPVANAGVAQTIQLPTSQATLSGSASTVTNGTIAAYAWTQQSGPSTAVITAPTAASTLVTGLSAGAYVFALKITDNTGKTSTATIQVTVNQIPQIPANPPPAAAALPGKIEAESYSSMSGVLTYPTTDAGGGLYVGWINRGDWMDYAVNVATAGTYTVSFRVSAPDSGGAFQLRAANGSVLATVTAPVTAGWDDFATVNAVIALPAGAQTLQLYSTSTVGWNINWLQFTSGSSFQPVPGKIEAESYSSMSGVLTYPTTDAGGGLYVGWINLGDWMDYAVNVAAAGNYTVSFRIAAPSAGGTFQLRTANGSVLTTVTAPVTSGWDNFATVNAVVTLPAGAQTLQLYSAATVSWNINWIQFVSGGTTTAAAQSAAMVFGTGLDSATAIPNNTDTASIALYPNPVKSTFTVGVNNTRTGNMLIQVIDVTGAIRKTQTLHKDQSPMLINISASDLPAGVYFVRVQVGAWSDIKKLLKY